MLALRKGVRLSTRAKCKVMICIVCVLCGVTVINALLGYGLNDYGIVPREFVGLRGIIFSPFLHGSIQHLIVNTLSFVVLGGLLLMKSAREFIGVILFVTVFGGLGVWLIGQTNSVHVGASGVIFGVFGYLVARGFVAKKTVDLLISILVIVFYGGLIWGVLPGRAGVSWEGHLCGLLAGIGYAYLGRRRV